MRTNLSFAGLPLPFVRHELRIRKGNEEISVAFDVYRGADVPAAYESVARLVKACAEGRFTEIKTEEDLRRLSGG